MPELTERQGRVELVAHLLLRNYPVIFIVRRLREKYGIARRTAYNLVQDAQREIAEHPGVHDPASLRAQQAARLEVIASAEDRVIVETGKDGVSHSHVVKGPSHGEKVAAIAEYNKLFGLHQPTKVALTDPQGKGISLHDIVVQVEEGRRTQVIDTSWVKEEVAKLPAPSGNGGEADDDE